MLDLVARAIEELIRNWKGYKNGNHKVSTHEKGAVTLGGVQGSAPEILSG